MKKIFLALIIISIVLTGIHCRQSSQKVLPMKKVNQTTVNSVINQLVALYGEREKERIQKGVTQLAALWLPTDGKEEDFKKFCIENFAGDTNSRNALFQRLLTNFEIIYGNFNKISLELKKPLHIDEGEILPIDEIFGAYDPYAHLNDDFFSNKIAFITILNFPFYTLQEKNTLGQKWTRKEWAYARLGDIFTSRVPADVLQKYSEAATSADTYISNYNICMWNLLDNNNNTLFPEGMKLISHWGLRDELKANYTGEKGSEKQNMIYQVMLRIINQEIPDSIINNPNYQWNPYTNKLYKDKKEIPFKPENDNRYSYLLGLFQAIQSIDKYNPQYPTYIQRAFEQGMEIPQEQVEKLFIEFVSSPVVKDVAKLIEKRLNRQLKPYDIWYDGFKPRSTIDQNVLNAKVQAKYKSTMDFQNDLPNILMKLNFTEAKAKDISSKIVVDPSRGAGHAWGAQMKGDVAHLRTRVPKDGWNYKGYNIALHEFGHNVEQTLSLYDVDYYSLSGVPNTGFTEALAFIFQKRDLEILGIKNEDPNKEYFQTLDNFWSCYEIMGVSLVDMNVWKWLYEHPNATKSELKEATIKIAKDVWNKYYADVFHVKDSPILAIYSHMIDNPLYLSNYPIGQIIQFQIEAYIKNKNFADEIIRMFTYGRTTPDMWMKHAVGTSLSIKPIIDATQEALQKVNK